MASYKMSKLGPFGFYSLAKFCVHIALFLANICNKHHRVKIVAKLETFQLLSF